MNNNRSLTISGFPCPHLLHVFRSPVLVLFKKGISQYGLNPFVGLISYGLHFCFFFILTKVLILEDITHLRSV